MSIKEMTLLDVIELSNRMDAASRDVSACGALRPAQRVSQRSCRFPAWFHPGITPLAPRLGPARVDHRVSIVPVAIAVSRLRQLPGIAAPLARWTQCIKTVTTRLRRIAASSLSQAEE
jgi:hypothetical protein